MQRTWRITNKQWIKISKHLPDNGAYIDDKACFEALLHSIWRRHPIREITELSDKHPGHSTLVPRIKLWETDGLLPYMIKTYSKSLSPKQRDRLRKLLLEKSGWLGIFIDEIRPSRSSRK